MSSQIATPHSREYLASLAYSIRHSIGIAKQLYFPVVEFMENILPSFIPEYTFEVLTVNEMGNLHGLTNFEEKTIKLREDIYEGALRGVGRDRFTCAHEIGHLFLHNSSTVQLARISPGETVKRYINPEWQANAFAGELLMPVSLIKGLTADYIAQQCKVSLPAAQTQLTLYWEAII